MRRPKVSVIIVSHNSEAVINHCLKGLSAQTNALDDIILVDSGSRDKSYLALLEKAYSLHLIKVENIGFSRANNLGMAQLPSHTDFVLFVNPDLFLPPDFIEKALLICSSDATIGITSGKLLGYDLEGDIPTDRIDSTGVKRKWYGRWYDRGQGELEHGQYEQPESMAALCGALLFCRRQALPKSPDTVFDPDFFLYKEDIELSLRMRKMGWKLLYHPKLQAYHCRGWQGERKKMSYELRKIAAKSEILLYKKHPSPYMIWAMFKYLLVIIFRL